MGSKVRLFVVHPLGQGQSVPLERDQAHYLFNVMRLSVRAEVALINGRDGEWTAEVAQAGKRGGVLVCLTQSAPLQMPPDLWLITAPVKKARMDLIVEKAVEMGARRIVPVQTLYTNEKFRADKAQAHAIEAAEQCGATYVPDVAPLVQLDRLLADWPAERQLLFCDEKLAGGPLQLASAQRGPGAIIIGPEGGFAPDERAAIAALGQTISLGPRILRADTAVVAAMTLWQATRGDWV